MTIDGFIFLMDCPVSDVGYWHASDEYLPALLTLPPLQFHTLAGSIMTIFMTAGHKGSSVFEPSGYTGEGLTGFRVVIFTPLN